VVLLVTIAVMVGTFVVLSGGDEDESSVAPATETTTTTDERTAATGATGTTRAPERKPIRPKPPTIVVRNAKPVGGVRELEFKSGERIRFAVRSDVGDEVHVHGYDRSSVVQPGGQVRFDFKANLEGVFEVELEQRHVQIAELRVEP
jgi:hypothetical protein